MGIRSARSLRGGTLSASGLAGLMHEIVRRRMLVPWTGSGADAQVSVLGVLMIELAIQPTSGQHATHPARIPTCVPGGRPRARRVIRMVLSYNRDEPELRPVLALVRECP